MLSLGPENGTSNENWNCSKCTYSNHPDLAQCEICEFARESYPTNRGGNNNVLSPPVGFGRSLSTLENLCALNSPINPELFNYNNNFGFLSSSNINNMFAELNANSNMCCNHRVSDDTNNQEQSSTCSAGLCKSGYCHNRLYQ